MRSVNHLHRGMTEIRVQHHNNALLLLQITPNALTNLRSRAYEVYFILLGTEPHQRPAPGEDLLVIARFCSYYQFPAGPSNPNLTQLHVWKRIFLHTVQNWLKFNVMHPKNTFTQACPV